MKDFLQRQIPFHRFHVAQHSQPRLKMRCLQGRPALTGGQYQAEGKKRLFRAVEPVFLRGGVDLLQIVVLVPGQEIAANQGPQQTQRLTTAQYAHIAMLPAANPVNGLLHGRTSVHPLAQAAKGQIILQHKRGTIQIETEKIRNLHRRTRA